MRLPSSKRGPLEVSGHKLEGAPVSRITSFTSHAQLNRHRISTDLDWNTVLPREYDEGKKRKGIKNTYCCSVTQSCPTLCDPTDCSTPGFSVLHNLPELGQTHVHQVGDAIQSSHPLLSLSSPSFNLSQHQGLFWQIDNLFVSRVDQNYYVISDSKALNNHPCLPRTKGFLEPDFSF